MNNEFGLLASLNPEGNSPSPPLHPELPLFTCIQCPWQVRDLQPHDSFSPALCFSPTHLPTLCFSPWGVLTDRLPSGARHNPEAQVEKSPERRTLISKDDGSPMVSLYPAVCRWATPKAPQASSGIPSKTELTGPQQRLTCSCAFHGPLFSCSQINHLHQSLDFGSSWRQMKLYSNL